MTPSPHPLRALLATAILLPLASAQQEVCNLEVRTATVTECLANTGTTSLTPSCVASCPTPLTSANPGGPVIVQVDAPRCDSCGCDACVHTNVYTTTYDVFCPTGLASQEYVVTETYTGMSGTPALPAPTAVPFGFTADVRTCTECGAEPVTATLTYPATGCPYILGVSEPTGAPEGVSPYEVWVTPAASVAVAVTLAPATSPSAGSSPGSGAAAQGAVNAPAAAVPQAAAGSGSGSPAAAAAAVSAAASAASPNPASGPSTAPESNTGKSKQTKPSSCVFPTLDSLEARLTKTTAEASPSSAAPTSAVGYTETSAGHPAFVAMTLGGLLGFAISFLAFAI
ncbi:hypothetical protein SLS53_008679 [Cytospora paraplurivora]|uniref:Uncharacterized protein n=1 Tax=Cytospora paraplurivora TaxID=2898453 RepID=A0AAN9YCT1_9PEZI